MNTIESKKLAEKMASNLIRELHILKIKPKLSRTECKELKRLNELAKLILTIK